MSQTIPRWKLPFAGATAELAVKLFKMLPPNIWFLAKDVMNNFSWKTKITLNDVSGNFPFMPTSSAAEFKISNHNIVTNVMYITK